jgi:tryptophanyl-tRNA synthetase
MNGKSIPEIEAEYEGKGYGDLKKDLGEVIVEGLAPIREHALELLDDPAELDRILDSGAERARKVASPVLRDAKTRMGVE